MSDNFEAKFKHVYYYYYRILFEIMKQANNIYKYAHMYRLPFLFSEILHISANTHILVRSKKKFVFHAALFFFFYVRNRGFIFILILHACLSLFK
jgi:hypothetical protein